VAPARNSKPALQRRGASNSTCDSAPLLAAGSAGYVRPLGTPLLAWVKGLPLAEEQTHALLEQVVRGYYQARFDPDGLPPARAQMLAAQSAAVIARLDAALSAASAPPTPAG
jgi:hypothetical protein